MFLQSYFIFPLYFVLFVSPDIDDKAKEIVYRNYVDISVAVSSPNGLVVPVLRNVEDMGEPLPVRSNRGPDSMRVNLWVVSDCYARSIRLDPFDSTHPSSPK